MELLPLDDHERAVLTRSHSLTLDAQQREVMVGLSRDESVWFYENMPRRHSGNWLEPGDEAKYMELVRRTEAARTVYLRAFGSNVYEDQKPQH